MECRIPKTVLVMVVVAVLGVVAAAVAIPLTSAPKFCATCHTIKPSYDSWVQSSHKDVTCVACHVRPTFEGFIQDKVIKGTHDVWVTVFGTPKKPEDLKATVYSEVCLSCHRNMLRISEIAVRDLSRYRCPRETVQGLQNRDPAGAHQVGRDPEGGAGVHRGLDSQGPSNAGLFPVPRWEDRRSE